VLSFNWEVSEHPAHSPDLTPSYFHLLLHLKKHLASQKFSQKQRSEKLSHYVVARAGSRAL
jgi:hypothetical protein